MEKGTNNHTVSTFKKWLIELIRSITSIISALTIISTAVYVGTGSRAMRSDILYILFIIFVTVLLINLPNVTRAFLKYLQPPTNSATREKAPKAEIFDSERIDKIEARIASIQSTIAFLKPTETAEEDATLRIDSFIEERANQVLSEEKLKSWIGDEFREEALKKAQFVQLEEHFEDIGYRLTGEINRSIRNANSNLLIGILTSGIGIALLIIDLTLRSRTNHSNAFDFFKDYLPRLTMVLFVELLAFFFLRIYKSNQSDIKHFQNEKTNLDLRAIALKTAFFLGDQQTINQILQSFVNSERNSVLNTGQTTVELEKEKLDQLVNKGVSERLSEILKIMNGKAPDKA